MMNSNNHKTCVMSEQTTPYEDLLPHLSEEEFEALKADIAQRGVQVPVEYDEHGNILDGHHRVRACHELGIKDWPRIVRVGMTDEEKIEHALTLNLTRRHLSREQRQELVAKLSQRGMSLRRIAELVGVGEKTVHRDRSAVSSDTPEHLLNESIGADGKAYPARQRTEAERQELVERAQRMQAEGASYREIATSLGVSVGTAYDLVRKPRPAVFARNEREMERVQEAVQQVAPEVFGDALLDAKRAVKKARAVVCEQQRHEMARAVAEIATSDRWQVWQDDIRTWQAPRQYDFIITDPPYPREYLSLYETLAERAAEWLAPGGLLVVMVGQSYLDEIIAMMTRHLDYYWTACYLLPEQPTPLRRRAVNTSWKPLLMFVRKGDEYRGKIFGDVFTSPKPAKDHHEWEQSVGGMLSIIRQLAVPGQFILDPFAGSGTTGVAALMHGCLFHGIDMDADAVAIAQKRLCEVVGCSDEGDDA
ncbi:MAG: hypothetical protein KatS3mg038_3625 [Candidatus Kapaibacterium sp.]|nr:MAG: hypothetical protein KatS3mg038_3625 [Candidatus Kapabacteria bacterium]